MSHSPNAPQFQLKNLPPGFKFPITRREIREFVKTSPAHFETVEFRGISSSHEPKHKDRIINTISVCYLHAEWRDGEWIFDLSVEGIRTEEYEGRRQEIAAALLSQIRVWVNGKLALSETDPKKPCRAHVYFDLTRKPAEIAELSEWS